MNPWLWTLYGLLTFWAITSVIFYGSRPTKSLGWVLAILIFPFGGPILYYLFGVNRRKFRLFRTRRYQQKLEFKIQKRDEEQNISRFDDYPHYRQLSHLLENAGHEFPTEGNKVQVLNDGHETFEALFDALEKAEKFIHLQYYIFEKGKLQDRLYDIFQKKTAEGVEIRLLYDSFGSFFFRGKKKKRFKSLGVELFPIMPIRLGNLIFSLNYRNHRKIMVIDGKVGFTGGINISDKYIANKDELGRWRDIHVRLEGPAVRRLHRIFLHDYYYAADEQELFEEKYLPKNDAVGDTTVQLVSSGPDTRFPSVMMQYVAMMDCAKKEISICNPYFIPGQTVLHAVIMAALKGVKVKLLVPKKSDSLLAKYSMYSNFESLLEAGVEIYLRTDFTHSKLLVVDNEITSIGSGNFDYRSFEHNFETNALIFNREIAKEALKDFNEHLETADRLHYEQFKDRPIYQRFLEGVAKFFAPLL